MVTSEIDKLRRKNHTLKMQTKNLQRQVKSLEESRDLFRKSAESYARSNFLPLQLLYEAYSETVMRALYDLKRNGRDFSGDNNLKDNCATFEACRRELETVVIELRKLPAVTIDVSNELTADDYSLIIKSLEEYGFLLYTRMRGDDLQSQRNANNYKIPIEKVQSLLKRLSDRIERGRYA